MEVKLEGMRESYRDVIDLAIEEGEERTSRNGDMLELLDVQLILERSERSLARGIGRSLSSSIACVEALSLIAGEAYPNLLDKVTSGAFERYMDGDVHHGSYGPRLRPQMDTLLRRLVDDKNSRQGVVTLWDPLYDQQERRDLPCTIALQFLVRDDTLLMTTFMRSNDIYRGFPYDVFQFTQLQQTIANHLRLDAGTYRHVVGSLHLYATDEDAARLVFRGDTEYADEFYGIVPPYAYRGDYTSRRPWRDYRGYANELLQGGGTSQPGCNLVQLSRKLLAR